MAIAAISNNLTQMLRRVGNAIFPDGATTSDKRGVAGNASGQLKNGSDDAGQRNASPRQGTGISILATGIGVAMPRALDMLV